MKKKIASLEKLVEFKSYEIDQLLHQLHETQSALRSCRAMQEQIFTKLEALQKHTCDTIASLRCDVAYEKALRDELRELQAKEEKLEQTMQKQKERIALEEGRKRALEKLIAKYERRLHDKERQHETALLDSLANRTLSHRG